MREQGRNGKGASGSRSEGSALDGGAGIGSGQQQSTTTAAPGPARGSAFPLLAERMALPGVWPSQQLLRDARLPR